MRKLLLFTVGVLLGLAFGGAIMLLLTPASGKQMREQAQTRYQDAMQAAREASDAKRKALEAELATLTGVRLNGADSLSQR